MWQTQHTYTQNILSFMVKAGSSQRKDEIFWLVTLSRLFSVFPKMPTFMALSGMVDRMPACDWRDYGLYAHSEDQQGSFAKHTQISAS